MRYSVLETGKGNTSTIGAEFNFRCDPEAANIVLNQLGCPLTVVGYEVCIDNGLSWVSMLAMPFSHISWALLYDFKSVLGKKLDQMVFFFLHKVASICKKMFVVWFEFYFALSIFQSYRDFEAEDAQYEIKVARPGFKPRIPCSASKELI